ncbi:type IV pilin protein [Schumannella sp. 10F1B-5-1]|uniref:type IV pilin protein n=1 Tax=Schumannella sp. 10F1B-5-1 TaxID=2590780 RepID=UPI00272C7EE9|nr:prepilin-type N-terminal cleavage/methylation domain-containing protein [Schumannella sp. 10F1B-5-1]
MTRIQDILAARMDRVKNGDKGFTLIELLVVVIIIGILAAIAIPVYIGVQNNAKDSAVKSDLGNAKTAVVAKYTQDGSYPTALTGLEGQGYTQSDASNYSSTSGSTPVISLVASNGGFCIKATSASGTQFAVSDKQAIAKGSCTTAGVYVAPTAP